MFPQSHEYGSEACLKTHLRLRVCVGHKVLTYEEYRTMSGVFQNIDPPTLLSSQRVCPPRRETITVRGQSYFSRLPKYWPPTPLSARRVCTNRLCCGGRTDSPGGEGDGGSIFWKKREIVLTSYSKMCTLWSSPSIKGGGYTLAGRWGVNILEDARHWIGFLHYNLSAVWGKLWGLIMRVLVELAWFFLYIQIQHQYYLLKSFYTLWYNLKWEAQ